MIIVTYATTRKDWPATRIVTLPAGTPLPEALAKARKADGPFKMSMLVEEPAPATWDKALRRGPVRSFVTGNGKVLVIR